MLIPTDDLLKFLLALLVGALIGLERELRDKSAGLRTLMIICGGSALFTLLSLKMVGGDQARIAANIVTGVGFIGAGVILREGGHIKGLTTASMIWLVAALGLGIGGGQTALSVSAALIILLLLWLVPFFERRIECIHVTRVYTIKSMAGLPKAEEVVSRAAKHRLRIRQQKLTRMGEELCFILELSGGLDAQNLFAASLYEDADISMLEY
ncbi:MAG: MgtC/SapB family protein [Anaerolineae bacterium]|nr:MgtC/SapB family protein [Anaerolineae bacterium]